MPMSRRSFTIEQIVSELADNPQRIAELVAGLKPAHLHAPQRPGEWSVNEVLAHLRACADVWGGCIDRILREERPTIRAIDPRTWVTGTDYPKQRFKVSFQAYTAQRAELLARLRRLKRDQWSRSARVVGAGKELERTVKFYAQWLARHEGTHVKHIRRMAAAMHAPDNDPLG